MIRLLTPKALGSFNDRTLGEKFWGCRINRETSSLARSIRNHQLCVGIYARPRPNVTPSFKFFFGADVLFSSRHECPDFIALKASNAKVASVFVMVFSVGAAKIAKQIQDGMLRNARGVNAVPFD